MSDTTNTEQGEGEPVEGVLEDAGQPRASLNWSLPGDPPEPAKRTKPEPAPAGLRTGDTHTGTDPLGRAIGPRENHLKVKRVRDPKTGEIVEPKPGKGQTIAKAEGRARKVAEDTGTESEGADDVLSPAEVARIHKGK